MPAMTGRPINSDLWELVKRPAKDAIKKIKLYESRTEKSLKRPEISADVTRYGYKALFADPWRANTRTYYDAVELDGLAELVDAIKEIPATLSKFRSPSSSIDEPSEPPKVAIDIVGMIPLVLADRYATRGYKELDDVALARLYIPQESYLLGTDLRGDVIVPLLGSQLVKGYRFKEFSIIRATPQLRSIFQTAQDVNPMDTTRLGGFDGALVIRNAPIDAVGYGFYFGAGPDHDGYDLIERFFDGLNIAVPQSNWYVQLAVKPHGWIGYFEQPHGNTFCFTFRNHLQRLVNRSNFRREMQDDEMRAGYEYGIALKSCHPSIKVAAHRFMLAFDRGGNDDDTVVDMCIGLEAILGAGFGETVHRICVRAAAMLVQAGWGDSQVLYKAIRDVYSYRSKVVHGVRGPHKEEELHIDGEMIHATRFATATLSSLLKLTLSLDGFNPDKVDEEFVFTVLDRHRPSKLRAARQRVRRNR
jgi:hypothetical protein